MQNPYSVGVRPQQRRPDQRHHEVRHQPLPRRRLRLLPASGLELADQHREGERPDQAAQVPSATSSAATSAVPIIKDKLFFFGLYQRDMQRPDAAAQPARHVAHPDAGRLRRAAQRAAPRRPVGGEPPGRPASASASSRTSTAQSPMFRNVTTTLVNGVPIETGQTNVNIVDPSTYKSLLGRARLPLGRQRQPSPCATRYNDRVDDNAISNCGFGELLLRRTRTSRTRTSRCSETHTFSSNLLNEARFSLVKRDLDLPGERSRQPDAPPSRASSRSAAPPTSRRAASSDAYQFSDTADLDCKGKHSMKFGADIRYNNAGQQRRLRLEGHVHVQQPAGLHEQQRRRRFQQALQTASFVAKQWQTFFFVQDDFRVHART